MLAIHPQARTTPVVRQEIARSTEPTGVLAQRFRRVAASPQGRRCRQGGLASRQLAHLHGMRRRQEPIGQDDEEST